jgi:linoleoyl-CoA desaturase
MFSTFYSSQIKCIFASFAGLFYVSLGFNVFHDSSHYAFSIYPKTNILLTKLWASWGLWNDKIWFYHHVLNHHSFTGEERKDPDLYHLKPFANKSKSTKKQLFNNKIYLIPFLLIVFLGQYIGQSISYLISLFNKKIFGIKIPVLYKKIDLLDIILIVGKLYCLYNGFYLPIISYYITINFWYHINIVLDHDTYESSVINHYEGDDWLKLQVCNSSNFLNGNIIWTRFFGAINYQIEHHLFPNISSVHYPTIAPIVRDFCNENNIPYVNYPSLWECYKSFMKTMYHYNSF